MGKPETGRGLDTGGGVLRGHLALVAVQFCFGLFPIFGKLAMQDFTPSSVTVWRFLVGSAALLGLAFLRYGRAALPRRSDLVRLLACAMLGVGINMVVFMEGLERTTSVNAGLLMPMIPVYTLVIAVAVGQERFDGRRAFGLLLALSGTLVLLLHRGPDFSREHLIGNLFIVGNTLSYSIYLVASKPLLERYPPQVLIAWVFTFSLWTIPLFWGGAADGEPLVPAEATRQAWLSLGYVLVFATLVSYILNTFALALVSASTTATYILLQPLISAVGGVLVLGEVISAGTWVAAAGILAGVWLVVRPPRRTPRVAPARSKG